jgi:hypothetical protein
MEKEIHKVARVDRRVIASRSSTGSVVQGVFGGSTVKEISAMAKTDVMYTSHVTAHIALNHLTQGINHQVPGEPVREKGSGRPS